MKRILLWTVNIGAPTLALYFGQSWVYRQSLMYNTQGKYFEEVNSVVYDNYALWVYGISTIIFAVISVLSWIKTWRLKRKSH